MRFTLAMLCLTVLPILALAEEPLAAPVPSTAPAIAPTITPSISPSIAKTAPIEVRAGTLRAVRGTVQLTGEGNTMRTARAGDAVGRSQQLVTASDGSASIVLRDGTALVVGPSTRMELKDFHFDSTTQQGGMWVSLLRGSLRMITGLIGVRQPSAVQLQARTVTVGICGTDFIVQVEEE